LRHYGYNMSHWNFHERVLSLESEKYFVNNKDELVIFHFSGYDPLNKETLTKPTKQNKFTMANREDLRMIHDDYRNKVLENQYEKYFKMKYSYAMFDNGKPISKLNRRLYRKLTDENQSFENPFNSDAVFYGLMDKSNLISEIIALVDVGKINYSNLESKEKILQYVFKLSKKVLGVDKYTALLKGLQKYSKYENQKFLIND